MCIDIGLSVLSVIYLYDLPSGNIDLTLTWYVFAGEEFVFCLLIFYEEVLVIHVLMPIAVEVPSIFWKLQTLEVQ